MSSYIGKCTLDIFGLSISQFQPQFIQCYCKAFWEPVCISPGFGAKPVYAAHQLVIVMH